MSNCGNCLNFELCAGMTAHYRKVDIKILKEAMCEEETEIHCDHYKDKSLVVELSCTVGDNVYLFDRALNILEFVISSYVIYSNGECHFVAYHKRDGWPVAKIFWSYEIGKTVFLSKEEAEEKKKRNRGKLWLMKRKIVRM